MLRSRGREGKEGGNGPPLILNDDDIQSNVLAFLGEGWVNIWRERWITFLHYKFSLSLWLECYYTKKSSIYPYWSLNFETRVHLIWWRYICFTDGLFGVDPMSASAAEANNDEVNYQKGEDADDSKGELFGSVKGFFYLTYQPQHWEKRLIISKVIIFQ